VRSPDVLVDSGAPIEPPPAQRPDRAAARKTWGFPANGTVTKVVLVYGGSQGSLAINNAVREWIRAGLPAGMNLIWGTGTKTYDEFASLESERIRVRPYLAPIAEAYAAADLAVARAGTMTLAELFAWRIPAVLIPLPTAAADHQTLNARTLEQAGAAVHLSQSELTGPKLGATVSALFENPARLTALAQAAALRARTRAADDIARRIVALASRRA
jgi:UDP-N-acetylglucosamine--N-acetylmuramyl-(pentapeptide) pyrophosphoryl-undecaprenol N-acetylglucosamine transferase